MAPRASPRKKAAVNYSEDDGKKPMTNGTAARTEPATTKRKAEAETVTEDKGVKKRKTKAKDAENGDAMPLAERTAVSSLKTAMHIGAHVSGAGGTKQSHSNAGRRKL